MSSLLYSVYSYVVDTDILLVGDCRSTFFYLKYRFSFSVALFKGHKQSYTVHSSLTKSCIHTISLLYLSKYTSGSGPKNILFPTKYQSRYCLISLIEFLLEVDCKDRFFPFNCGVTDSSKTCIWVSTDWNRISRILILIKNIDLK